MNRFAGNALTATLGIEWPILQGPMGGVAGAELVAAVSSAGGLGILPIWHQPVELAIEEIRRTRRLTDKAFGVNVRADLVQIEHIEAAIAEGIRIVHLFWGDPTASMAPIDRAGIAMLATVSDKASLSTALAAGASVVIVQGVEAGGHVLSEMPLKNLLSLVRAGSGDVPVIAAGGIVTAADVAAVVKEGADGALLGTRFVATRESLAHDAYQQALIEAGPDSTARSTCFDIGWPNAPHRTLKNQTYLTWQEAGCASRGDRPGEGEVVMFSGETGIVRYSVMPPAIGMTGDVREACLYAGAGVHRIDNCPSASDVVLDLASALVPNRAVHP